MERESSHASACATPPHHRWEAETVREKDVKLRSATNHLVQLTETGVPGHRGIVVLLLVVEESKRENDSVLTLSLNLVERTVLVMQL